MILFGLRDMGSVNACLPVVTILKDKGISVSVYAETPAYERLRDVSVIAIGKCETRNLFDSVKPSLVVVTPSTVGGTIPVGLTDGAKQKKLPVILIEDLWSGHSCSRWNSLPDAVCVVDSFAKNLIQDSWPAYSGSRIHITGSPVFDKFAKVNTVKIKSQLREILKLKESWPIIFFVGDVFGMVEAISIFVEALNKLETPVYLILGDHPKIILPDAPDEFKRIYGEYHEALKSLKMPIIKPDKLTSNEILAGSDVVVGICSTMMVEACYLRKPVLGIWTPKIGQALFKIAQNTFSDLPINKLGASMKAENVREIRDCLRKIIKGDTSAMRKAQEKHFKADGLNGNRIAETILDYYK